jgi:hypothetical protein
MIADPTARITFLDTFNELLIQNFSLRHPSLSGPYLAAVGAKNAVPDLGNWLRNPAIIGVVPRMAKWALDVHDARVTGELAHAKGKKSGKLTGPISFDQAEKLIKQAQSAWAELIVEWKKIL